MKKFLALALALVMLLAVAVPASAADLMADQTSDVGDVSVVYDGTTVQVDFTINAAATIGDIVDTGDWVMTETQIYVGDKAPKKSAPGSFPCIYEGDSVTGSYTITLSDLGITDSPTPLYVAIHATLANTVEGIIGYNDDGSAILGNVPVEESAWVFLTADEASVAGAANGAAFTGTSKSWANLFTLPLSTVTP